MDVGTVIGRWRACNTEQLEPIWADFNVEDNKCSLISTSLCSLTVLVPF